MNESLPQRCHRRLRVKKERRDSCGKYGIKITKAQIRTIVKTVRRTPLQATEGAWAACAAPNSGEENRQPPKVSFNFPDQLPGRRQRPQPTQNQNAGSVNC